MAFHGGALKGEEDAGPEAPGVVQGETELYGHAVGRLESDTTDIRIQLVRVFLQDRYAVIFVGLVYLRAQAVRKIIPFEPDHNLADTLLLLDRFDDRKDSFLADTLDFSETFGLVVEDVQGLFAKGLDDLFGEHGAHELNKSGSKVPLNTFFVGGAHFLDRGDLEVGPVLPDNHFSGRLHGHSLVNLRHNSDKGLSASRDIFPGAVLLHYTQDRETVFLVPVTYEFYKSFDSLHKKRY